MAASFSLSNFLPFLSPAKPSLHQNLSLSPQQLQLNPHSSSTRFPSQTQKFGANLVPLRVHDEDHSSSSTSSYLSSVICPSLAYANTLFFKSAYNVQVVVEDNEPEERLINRFRREVMKAGVIQECKRRRFFENTQESKKRKSREAAKRNRRRFLFFDLIHSFLSCILFT